MADYSQAASWPTSLGTVFAIVFAYIVSLVLNRLYFSPLARFPGPKLAAATSWYECYYDVIKDGLFFKQIQKLHKQYGPIVRITPNEIHIADSDFFDVFNNSKLDKDPHLYDMTNLPLSLFGTKEHEVHRKRRAAINPFFSRSNIDAQMPLVQEKTMLLCEQLKKSAESGEPTLLDLDYTCLTIDVVTQCAFGKSYGALGNPRLAKETNDVVELAEKSNHINRCFPPVRKLLNTAPSSLLVSLTPRFQAVVDFQVAVRARVKEILKKKDEYMEFKSEKRAKPTIYHQLLTSGLPPEELTEQRLTEDGTAVVSAGLTTTAKALTVTTFHLIDQPTVLATLRAEITPLLAYSAPNLPTYSELERLPYLSAVIKEGIRLSWGTSSRLPRITRTPLTFNTYTIPPGTVVSMNTNDVLMDPSIFTSPETFNVSRWLDPKTGEKSKNLDKYFVAFGKGPRSCVGLWLAYAEMYVALAAVFGKFDFELGKGMDERRVANERDFFTPHPNSGFEGFRVVVKDRQGS